MNRKIILSLLIVCIISIGFSQLPRELFSVKGSSKTDNYFEGRISYKAGFLNKTNKYDSGLLAMAIGKYSNYYYKQGNFLIKAYNTISYTSLYRMEDNRMYTQKVWSDSIFYVDCSRPGFKILNFTITPKKETILGILCDELKVFYENKTITNYFNSDTLKMDPSWHQKYTFYNEDFNCKQMKAISLKFIIDKPDYMVTYTATSITPMHLHDSLFALPKNKILIEED